MMQYQQADPVAAAALVNLLSPQLYRFFTSQLGARTDEDLLPLLKDVWLHIHRVRHTYRPRDPMLPWIYAIARCVQVDSYPSRHAIAASHEMAAHAPPEPPVREDEMSNLPPFEVLMAALPGSQREVLAMLKVNGLSIEEVARATSSTVGAIKQKAHRAYERLRKLLEAAPAAGPGRKGAAT
jgi:RNA polymerase sigma-70 factor (ECF subfamily)